MEEIFATRLKALDEEFKQAETDLNSARELVFNIEKRMTAISAAYKEVIKIKELFLNPKKEEAVVGQLASVAEAEDVKEQ